MENTEKTPFIKNNDSNEIKKPNTKIELKNLLREYLKNSSSPQDSYYLEGKYSNPNFQLDELKSDVYNSLKEKLEENNFDINSIDNNYELLVQLLSMGYTIEDIVNGAQQIGYNIDRNILFEYIINNEQGEELSDSIISEILGLLKTAENKFELAKETIISLFSKGYNVSKLSSEIETNLLFCSNNDGSNNIGIIYIREAIKDYILKNQGKANLKDLFIYGINAGIDIEDLYSSLYYLGYINEKEFLKLSYYYNVEQFSNIDIEKLIDEILSNQVETPEDFDKLISDMSIFNKFRPKISEDFVKNFYLSEENRDIYYQLRDSYKKIGKNIIPTDEEIFEALQYCYNEGWSQEDIKNKIDAVKNYIININEIKLQFGNKFASFINDNGRNEIDNSTINKIFNNGLYNDFVIYITTEPISHNDFLNPLIIKKLIEKREDKLIKLLGKAYSTYYGLNNTQKGIEKFVNDNGTYFNEHEKKYLNEELYNYLYEGFYNKNEGDIAALIISQENFKINNEIFKEKSQKLETFLNNGARTQEILDEIKSLVINNKLKIISKGDKYLGTYDGELLWNNLKNNWGNFELNGGYPNPIDNYGNYPNSNNESYTFILKDTTNLIDFDIGKILENFDIGNSGEDGIIKAGMNGIVRYDYITGKIIFKKSYSDLGISVSQIHEIVQKDEYIVIRIISGNRVISINTQNNQIFDSNNLGQKQKDKLNYFGITNLDNFYDEGFINNILENRELLEKGDKASIEKLKEKPIVLLIYPKEDHNGAFNDPKIIDFYKKGYNVIFTEIANENEFKGLLSDILNSGIKDIVGLFGGHGNQNILQFGTSGEKDDNYLDIYDFSDYEIYRGIFKKISLLSCSTGKGGKTSINLANFINYAFMPEYGVEAPMEDTNGNFMFDENGTFTGLKYLGVDTYQTGKLL